MTDQQQDEPFQREHLMEGASELLFERCDHPPPWDLSNRSSSCSKRCATLGPVRDPLSKAPAVPEPPRSPSKAPGRRRREDLWRS